MAKYYFCGMNNTRREYYSCFMKFDNTGVSLKLPLLLNKFIKSDDITKIVLYRKSKYIGIEYFNEEAENKRELIRIDNYSFRKVLIHLLDFNKPLEIREKALNRSIWDGGDV